MREHDKLKAVVEYVGFEAKAAAREYNFIVRTTHIDPRRICLSIANEAFVSRRAQFQEAPDICALKLHRMLQETEGLALEPKLSVSDEELEAYRSAHMPRQSKYPWGKKRPASGPSEPGPPAVV